MSDSGEVRFSATRRAIASRLRESVRDKPAVTLFRAAPWDPLLRWRDAINGSAGARPLVASLLAKVVATALTKSPSMNGWVGEYSVTRVPSVSIGVATQTSRGLLVPVVHRVSEKPVQVVDDELRDLVAKAREGRLLPTDFGGGTFTVSNMGASGVSYFTPIINPPQIAILGTGTVSVVPKHDASSGLWQEHNELPLSLTFDHAAVDGLEAAAFLGHVCSLLADPELVFQS